jgi:hypothetical protein
MGVGEGFVKHQDVIFCKIIDSSLSPARQRGTAFLAGTSGSGGRSQHFF